MIASRTNLGEALKHLVLILGALFVILPFYVMVSYSLKSPGEIERNEGGFIGAQQPMLDGRCFKLKEPTRQRIETARERFEGQSDDTIRQTLEA
ncbi:MAG: hypothetical protein AAFU66_10680, partial [Pseudomonadota bacterium]